MSAYQILMRSQVLKLQLTYLIQVTSNQIIGSAAIDSLILRTQSSRVTQHGIELSSVIICGEKKPPSQLGTSTLVRGGYCSNQFFNFRVRLIKRLANSNSSCLFIFLKEFSFGSLRLYMLLFFITSKMLLSSFTSYLFESRFSGALSLLAISTEERFFESFCTYSS